MSRDLSSDIEQLLDEDSVVNEAPETMVRVKGEALTVIETWKRRVIKPNGAPGRWESKAEVADKLLRFAHTKLLEMKAKRTSRTST